MNERLEARAQAVRRRWLVRSWEYRRRHSSAGVWLRLARALAGAREVFVLDAADAARLEALGATPLDVGLELHPHKRLFVVSEEQLTSLPSARSIVVRISAEFLSAPQLALLPFEASVRAP